MVQKKSVSASNLSMRAGLGHSSNCVLRGYTSDGENVTTIQIDFQDDGNQAVLDMFADLSIDTVDVYKIYEEYHDTFYRDEFVL